MLGLLSGFGPSENVPSCASAVSVASSSEPPDARCTPLMLLLHSKCCNLTVLELSSAAAATAIAGCKDHVSPCGEAARFPVVCPEALRHGLSIFAEQKSVTFLVNFQLVTSTVAEAE